MAILIMTEIIEDNVEKVVLIGLITQYQNEEKCNEYLDELEFLTLTAGGIAVKRFVQKLETPNPKTFIGTGKLEDVRQYIEANNVGTVIFDDELKSSQLRNIEKVLNIKVLDRTNLILDIFAARAQTSYARTQVELAQCQYLLPRLTRLWTHLERQKGGIGLRGPGGTEIETVGCMFVHRYICVSSCCNSLRFQCLSMRIRLHFIWNYPVNIFLHRKYIYYSHIAS